MKQCKFCGKIISPIIDYRKEFFLMRLGILGQEYTFVNLPSELLDYSFEPVETSVEVEHGETKEYAEGFKFRGTLDFQDSWIDETQFEALRALFDLKYTSNNILSFYLNEIKYPKLRINVKWKNGLNFTPIKGTEWGYFKGSIELEGADVLTAAPKLE